MARHALDRYIVALMLASSQVRARAMLRWHVGLALMIASTVGVALALGGAHIYVLLAIAPICLAGCACLLGNDMVENTDCSFAWPAPTWILLALAFYTLLQAIPMPVWLLERLSPESADIWARALSPFQEPVDVGAISLAPRESVKEALKWLLYGVNFCAATLLARRYGRGFPAIVVFACALAVAIATLAHTLAHATKVFGFYEPPLGARGLVGPFLNQNSLSAYLNLGAFTGLGLVFSRRFEARRWLLASGVGTLFGVSVLSGSRGGVWILPFGLLLFAILRQWRQKRRSSFLARPWLDRAPLLVAVGSGLVFALLGASQLTWNGLRQDDFEKLKLAGWSLPLIKDFWLFGVGRGAFGTVFPAYSPPTGNKIFTYPENFIVQWCSEWGVPLAVLAMGALLWAFRPRNVSIRGSNLGAGAATGVAVVFTQNLVDFGLERAATPLAVTWALAVLWRPDRRPRTTTAGGAAERPRRLSSSILLALGGGLWIFTLLFAHEDERSEQKALHEAAQAVNFRDEDSVEALRSRLRAAMLRTPAEPYLARLGGEVSLLGRKPDTMRWVSRALERGMNEPETHLLAAQVLHASGVAKQALLELRLAAELDPMATVVAGRLAADWSKSLDDVLRAAPGGAAGAKVLMAAADNFKASSERGLYEAALRAALMRDKESQQAREALARYLVAQLKSGHCDANLHPACVEQALVQVNALIDSSPDRFLGVKLKTQLLQKLGREDEADALLAKPCPSLTDKSYRECLRSRLSLIRSSKTPSRAQIESIARELLKQPCGTRKACARLSTELGRALIQAGHPEGAMTHFERAARQDPSVPALFNIAEVAVDVGQYRRAESALRKAQRIAKPSEFAAIAAKRSLVRRRMLKDLSGLDR